MDQPIRAARVKDNSVVSVIFSELRLCLNSEIRPERVESGLDFCR